MNENKIYLERREEMCRPFPGITMSRIPFSQLNLLDLFPLGVTTIIKALLKFMKVSFFPNRQQSAFHSTVILCDPSQKSLPSR